MLGLLVKSYNLASHYGFLSRDGLGDDVGLAEAAPARRQPTVCPNEEDPCTGVAVQSPTLGNPCPD